MVTDIELIYTGSWKTDAKIGCCHRIDNHLVTFPNSSQTLVTLAKLDVRYTRFIIQGHGFLKSALVFFLSAPF